MDRNAPIGVFDSGVGGLTVAREIMRRMPGERIVYFGDTARLPYGSKSQDTVLRYSRQIIRFLMTRQVKAIVIACNTASAYALKTVEQETEIPVIGVIRAGARQRQDRSHRNRGHHKQRPLYGYHEGDETGHPGHGKSLPSLCPSGGGGAVPRFGDR